MERYLTYIPDLFIFFCFWYRYLAVGKVGRYRCNR